MFIYFFAIEQPKLIQIPNQCPFKEEILREVEEVKRKQEEEREKLKQEAIKKKREANEGLHGLVSNEKKKGIKQELLILSAKSKDTRGVVKNKENALKSCYKEFKKVLNTADIILEVVDARDPLGTRCKQVQEAVQSAGDNKKLIIVLNKVDLISGENLDQWLKFLRTSALVVPFKSYTQNRKLGKRKLEQKGKEDSQCGTCYGSDLLLSLLSHFCKNSKTVKSSFRVGIVGLPNVGKSSVINSLMKNKVCSIAASPGNIFNYILIYTNVGNSLE